MIRGPPGEMGDREDEGEIAKQGVIHNLVFFCFTVAVIRAVPFVVQLL